MTKSELIARLSARYPQFDAKDAEVAVNLILNAIAQSLAKGQHIEIRGFGSFDLKYRIARTARNPGSGEKVHIPGKHHPHFKAAKELRERVDTPQAPTGASKVPRNQANVRGVLEPT